MTLLIPLALLIPGCAERQGMSVPREPAPWPALRPLNQWYLESNLGWTLLVVPGALIGVWLMLTKNTAPAAAKQKGRPQAPFP